MYICICNRITDRQVKAAVRAGAKGWKDVHAHHGCKPNCGKCQCEIIEAIAEHRVDQSQFAGPLLASSAMAGAD